MIPQACHHRRISGLAARQRGHVSIPHWSVSKSSDCHRRVLRLQRNNRKRGKCPMRAKNILSLFASAGPILATISMTATAAISSPAPGTYIYTGGGGSLVVKRLDVQKMHFSIETIGGNAHECSLKGEILNDQAILDVGSKGAKCVVTFRSTDGGIEVSGGDSEACRYFCGMRAMFDGEYLKPDRGCSNVERRQRRQEFQKRYHVKDYLGAAPILEDILLRCNKVIDWLEDGQIRNDLAITLYHLGRSADCKKTLEPLLAYEVRTENGLRERLPPTDLDNYWSIANATWHNAGLCEDRDK
jgi:hypothetical protein